MILMKRENIYKASELDARIIKIDQELVQLNNRNVSEIIVRKVLLPEFFEEVRLKQIEALTKLKAEYEKVIEELA